MEQPWSFDTAHQRFHETQRNQDEAIAQLREAGRDFAEKERSYRIAYAQKILAYRAEGMAATVCADLARGDEVVARLRFERDLAESVREVAIQNGWKANKDRSTTEEFIRWSKARDLAEGHGDPHPDFDPATGEVRVSRGGAR